MEKAQAVNVIGNSPVGLIKSIHIEKDGQTFLYQTKHCYDSAEDNEMSARIVRHAITIPKIAFCALCTAGKMLSNESDIA